MRFHLTALGLCAGVACAHAQQPVRSLLEVRTAGVITQKWDSSCGAAALATLLTHHFGHPVTEKAVAQAMLGHTDVLRVKHRGGFSLLDLKRYSQNRGFVAEAFQSVSLEELDDMAPAIVPVNFYGYPHFVIYRGRVGQTVLLSDPAFGNRTISRERLEHDWVGSIAFTVRAHASADSRQPVPIRQADSMHVPAAALRAVLR